MAIYFVPAIEMETPVIGSNAKLPLLSLRGAPATKQSLTLGLFGPKIARFLGPMKDHNYYVYILTNKNRTVLYTGVTNDLPRRVWQHKNKFFKGFTKKYNVDRLVYLEWTDGIEGAIFREKQIKGGSRQDKIELINKANPNWEDLSEGWF